jgi:biopolymer transport protein ExbD
MNGQMQKLEAGEKLILPAALQSEVLEDGVLVRIENDELFLENKKISQDNLAKAILAAKKPANASIIIQADRRSDYEKIGMVLRAGGQAGFEKYVFAVTPGT